MVTLDIHSMQKTQNTPNPQKHQTDRVITDQCTELMNPQAGSACAMEVQQIGIYKTLDSSAVKPMNINYLKKEQSFFSNLVVFNPISYISSLIFRHFSLRAMARRLAAPLLLLAFHCTAWLSPDTPGPASRRKVLGGGVVATVATAPLAGAEELKSSWPAKDLTNDWDLCIQISSIFPSCRYL